jgi:FMN-dependent NADH-azoreductase
MYMSTLLHLDSSANAGVSLSRTLTAEFAAAWQAAHPVSAVIHRDLGLHAPAPLDRTVLAAIKAKPGDSLEEPAREARRASNLLVEEFLAADAFVMGVPMYNFSVPAGFKAWIDHVVQTGRTVVRGAKGSEPVVKGRKALVIATRAGDFSKGGARDGWDFVGPYLEKVLGYVGLETLILPVVNAPGRPDQDRLLAETRERMQYTLKRWLAAEAAQAEGTTGGLNHAA